MDVAYLIRQMADHAGAIQALGQGVSDEQARWKPGPDDWSILEVINHLYDEEIEDFRAHLDLILHRPDQPWPGIDPQGWVTARRYNERDLASSLQNLARARQESLAWLQGLAAPDWQAVYRTPFAQMAAGDMLAAWAAHDLLHLRQLVELHWAYTNHLVQPYSLQYAGDW
jgi:hypothetical protein